MATPAPPFKGHLCLDGTPHPSSCYLENGRWYGAFKPGRYLLPVDEPEMERLDVFHKLVMVARRGLIYSSPLQDGTAPRVLDVGCGSGIWSINMADKFPLGQHKGIDLNYVQPKEIPENTSFDRCDVEDEWVDLGPSSWDLIHICALNGSIRDWPKLYSQILNHLRPENGYFEQIEVDFTPRSEDGSLPRDGHMVRWANEVMDAMDRLGRPLRLNSQLTKQRLDDAGFVDVKEEVINLPLNGWPRDVHGRDVGRWFNLALRLSLQPLMLAPLSRTSSRTPEEIHELSEKVRKEIFSNSVHAFCTLHVFTARRPR